MTPLADAAAREAIARDLDATFIVEAAAGTGKTTELVRRIVAVLAAGRGAIGGLVAVTFTEKAAGELKLRLRAALETARQNATAGSAERGHLELALARLEEARVGTIHGLCADLLRERPIEAGVDPLFRVLPEGDAERLFRATFARWLQEQMHDPPEGLRRSLRRRSTGGDDGPSERLLRAAWQLTGWRHFDADWQRPPFDRAAVIDALFAQVADFAALTEHCANPRSDPLYRETAAARRLRDAVARAEAVRGRDYDELEATLVALAADRDFRRARPGRGTFYFKEITRAAVRDAHAELGSALEAFRRDIDADLAAAIRGELRGALARYEEAKTRAGALDFLDLLLRARGLLRDAAAVRADFQRRCTHLFVDEFQDTDPLQAEILLLLAADDPAARDWRQARPTAGKLFLVGDPKQSIYRFRGADVGIYLEVKTRLLAAGACCVELTTSFRAVPSLQAFVNTAFATQLRADPQALQADYVPLTPARDEAQGRPSIIALPVPKPYGRNDKIAKVAIDRSLPDAVAAFLEWLFASGWTVSERERPGTPVPLAPRHVCLLFRRFDSFFAGDITRGYVRALEARGISHLLVGGKSFHVREEVETMRAALAAIEWPQDELSLYATLRGSLFAISDEALFLYRQAHRALHPFRIAAELPAALAPIGEALALLGDLHRGRNRRPVADTIARLLDATRAHAGFALRPSGEQALANVLHVAELARTYEVGGGISFRGFVERLQEEAERAQTAEAPILEEGSDGVRLMTVHRAKGLEFPVVVLADITCGLTGAVGRHVDPERGVCALRIGGWAPRELLDHEPLETARDTAEAVRVAYVAATRARDLLVVPAVGDGRFDDGWIGGLNDALYPTDRRAATPAPGCPPFGRDSVRERPPELAFDADPVRPGRHARDGYDVTWWDPALLRLGVATRFGIRQEELLGKDAPAAVREAGLQRFAAWQAARDDALTRGAQPSCTVRTATARAAEETAAAPPAVDIVEVPRAAGRPAGPRFGALVHAMLAMTPLTATADAITAVATVQARILGAPADELAAAVATVAAALAHPLLRAAAGAPVLRRETPLSLLDDDGTLVEGVVDLAFRDAAGWTVVDYKTDQELSAHAAIYRRQVALYARALAMATGHAARAVLLRV
ncbi:MAG TPA: UvrD-helicase domain-containing protein [Candidatus Dormibacteraeota bacterium]|nr:UvrD-helicase domain-containing protein [Candidatus Dormibacteraeota bacterium]